MPCVPRRVIVVLGFIVLVALLSLLYFLFFPRVPLTATTSCPSCPLPSPTPPAPPQVSPPCSGDSVVVISVPVPVGEEALTPWLAGDRDLEVFNGALDHATTYLEFGSGGSTYQANLRPHIRRVFSIEGSQEYVDNLQKTPSIAWSVSSGRITFMVPSCGPLEAAAWPKRDEIEKYRSLYPNHPNQLLEIPEEELDEIDFVFVDGRFRVACACLALLHTKSKIFVWDDYLNRPYFHVIEEFLSRVEFGKTLVRFERKESIDYERVKEMFEEHKYDPR